MVSGGRRYTGMLCSVSDCRSQVFMRWPVWGRIGKRGIEDHLGMSVKDKMSNHAAGRGDGKHGTSRTAWV
jgi:hypothetical protein